LRDHLKVCDPCKDAYRKEVDGWVKTEEEMMRRFAIKSSIDEILNNSDWLGFFC
jgi:hypothetical protein